MSRRFAAFACCLMVSVVSGLLLLSQDIIGQEKKTPSPDKLLPASTLLYVGWDGTDAHATAWQKTAAYKAVVDSGLIGLFDKVMILIAREAGEEPTKMAKATLEHLGKKGLYLSIATAQVEQGPPLPQITAVVPNGAEAVPAINNILAQLGAQGAFQTEDVGGRKVSRGIIPQTPGIEVGWWTEGTHLVIAAGFGAVDAALAVASGKSPNIGTNAVWKKCQAKADFESALVAWVDLGTIRQMAGGIPIPAANQNEQQSVGDVLKTLGLDKIGPLAMRWGFKGDALWTETTLEAPGPHTGLLSFADQKPISLKELPPLPAMTDGFYAWRTDWSKTFEGIAGIASAAMKQFGPPGAPSLDDAKSIIKKEMGFDLQQGLLDPLGDVTTLYGDSSQGFFGMGLGLAISVDDAKTLRSSIDKLLTKLMEAAAREVSVQTVKRGANSIRFLQIHEVPFISPALAVTDKWLVIGLYPQTVESFLLRDDGKLAKWEPTAAVTAAIGELPKSYTSLSVSDPREGLRTAISFAPMITAFAQMEMRNRTRFQPDQPQQNVPPAVTLADFPPAELVTRPLFVNVSVCSTTDTEIRWVGRSSLPAVPFFGGAGVGGGGAATPILVALLLPAVQQAREAARRTQSKNNLKQIGLALHNYHDSFNAFPAGTHANDKLKPEKRLSWMADLLPYLDQAPLYNQIDFKKAWDDDANAMFMKARVPVFIHPNVGDDPSSKHGQAHYVGIAGVGKDAPTLPVTDRKAGVFGYNRICRIRDILDGTSNTIGVTEASKDFGPWGAGGPSSIRALTKKPYINGPDGIGSRHVGGLNVLMMDGSVRFVSENIDPDLFEKLTTIAGGEVIGAF